MVSENELTFFFILAYIPITRNFQCKIPQGFL